MNKSETIGELAAALALAQKAFKPVLKTADVDYSTNAGRKHYSYSPLDKVIEATRDGLTINGLAITQPTRVDTGKLIVETWLIHKSGEWLQSEMYVGGIEQTPQAEGSALTYKRRYSMSAILGVASEDDDDAISAMPKTAEKAHVTPSEPHTATQPTEGVQTDGHYCLEHGVKYFKKGGMKGYAHPIDDTGKWCNEPVEVPQSAASISILSASPVEVTYDDVQDAWGKPDGKATKRQKDNIARFRNDQERPWKYIPALKMAEIKPTTVPNELTIAEADKLIELAQADGYLAE